jgi:hypothetical protein
MTKYRRTHLPCFVFFRNHPEWIIASSEDNVDSTANIVVVVGFEEMFVGIFDGVAATNKHVSLFATVSE